ncbi:MAG: helix-turn-helix transcriptional regulator [Clostridia bacterium]|nr:helix-turn-helix transcriptional regulator [Clostridia bacterium]
MALDYSIIGERLKQARMNKRLTQEKLAEKLEVSVAFLSRIERGSSHINLNRLNQICTILDVSEGEILNGVSKDSSLYLNRDFSNLLKNCPPEKISLIYKVAKVISEN